MELLGVLELTLTFEIPEESRDRNLSSGGYALLRDLGNTHPAQVVILKECGVDNRIQFGNEGAELTFIVQARNRGYTVVEYVSAEAIQRIEETIRTIFQGAKRRKTGVMLLCFEPYFEELTAISAAQMWGFMRDYLSDKFSEIRQVDLASVTSISPRVHILITMPCKETIHKTVEAVEKLVDHCKDLQ